VANDGPVCGDDRPVWPTGPFVAPQAAVSHRRSPAQRADPALAWARPDRAFFAAGACHVLADRVRRRFPEHDLELVYIRPTGPMGHHVFVSDGDVALDFNGWSHDKELVAVNVAACRDLDPNWDFVRLTITVPLDDFCRRYQHRRPDQFPGDVLRRADHYLDHIL
jgi:hypothetical protein